MNTTTRFITFISFTFLAVSASASIPDFVTPGNNIAKQIIEGQRTKFTEIGDGSASGVNGLRGFGTNVSSIRRNKNSSLEGFKFKADDSLDLGNSFEKE